MLLKLVKFMPHPIEQDQQWTSIVDANDGGRIGGLKEIWEYRDLILVLVKKYFKQVFRQTILGPVWIALNPIFSTFIFALVLGYFAKMPSDGLPVMVFYLAGGIIWGYFSNAFSNISNVLLNNSHIIKKIYLPRIILPFAEGITALAKFMIVLALSIPIFFYYAFNGTTSPNAWLFILPILLALLFFLTLGLGLIFASLMVKHRDLSVLIPFFTSSTLFLSPILYPTSIVPERFRFIYELNPLTGIIECLRYGIAGSGSFEISMLISSSLVTALIFITGILLFKKIGALAPDHI